MNFPSLKQSGAREAVSGEFRLGGDVILVRSAANTLAMRNGTNPQAFIVNGTWTDGSNFRRGRLAVDAAGMVTLACEGLGTGVAGNGFTLSVDGVNLLQWASGSTTGVFGGSLQLGTSSTYRWGSTRSRMASPSDGTINFTNAAGSAFTALQFGGTQILGVRNTGWTAQTATPAKGDLGASPTNAQLASWCAAMQSALTTHGIIGA